MSLKQDILAAQLALQALANSEEIKLRWYWRMSLNIVLAFLPQVIEQLGVLDG